MMLDSVKLTAFKAGRVLFELLSPIAKTFPLTVTKGVSFPYIVYRRAGYNPNRSKDLVGMIELQFEIIVFATSYEQSIELAQQMWEALDGTDGEIAGLDVVEIKVTNSSENYVEGDSGVYMQHLNVTMWVENN